MDVLKFNEDDMKHAVETKTALSVLADFEAINPHAMDSEGIINANRTDIGRELNALMKHILKKRGIETEDGSVQGFSLFYKSEQDAQQRYVIPTDSEDQNMRANVNLVNAKIHEVVIDVMSSSEGRLIGAEKEFRIVYSLSAATTTFRHLYFCEFNNRHHLQYGTIQDALFDALETRGHPYDNKALGIISSDAPLALQVKKLFMRYRATADFQFTESTDLEDYAGERTLIRRLRKFIQSHVIFAPKGKMWNIEDHPDVKAYVDRLNEQDKKAADERWQRVLKGFDEIKKRPRKKKRP